MKTIGSSTYALDTNIVIDLFKGRRDIADKIDAAQKVYLPIPTLAELYLGAENSLRKAHHLEQISAFLKLTEVLNTSHRTAELYSVLKAHLRRQGTPIPENDIWIAALAKEHDLPVITRDKHFKNLPGLQIVEWWSTV